MSKKRSENIVSLFEIFVSLERKWMNDWNHLNEVGLSKTHILILQILETEGLKRPSILAEQLQITTGGVTVLTSKLIKDGFVQKCQNERDRRAYNLEITDSGKDLLHSARSQINQQIQKMFGMLSDDEIQNLRDIFYKCLMGQ
ncbi:MarR family transcriptional regulator [Metabacillus idriensis]|uniref:MarR family transcriptional regulator n=1 Tax=Metabacillus idriensis TaxID=324768 RepID=A0A6I2MHS3_9BACI|nr:MarR family transcriptional regulator [Metabacillus idriensis]MCM3595998.1 MarR family transcriptional regulator [Metabacillus idriensis]MDR0137781.1 MarR family transcriptional regulator [Metabacillus idriensis]MRX56682.1 MarR family transcriptional regulator [Metabacillus idriensis]OHR73846.1 RNA polymerase subunit sigma [Bacillus sp. HMSC76G11]